MIDIGLRSEFSFKQCFGHIEQLVNDTSGWAIGIADINSTYGHVKLEKICLSAGKRPLFGVKIQVGIAPKKKDQKKQKQFGPQYTFIAKNNDGLTELYGLVKKAWDNFYYHPIIFMKDVVDISENVYVIAESFEVPDRLDYIGISFSSPTGMIDYAYDLRIPIVAMNCNSYSHAGDKEVYEIFAGERGRALQTYPQHILSQDEWQTWFGNHPEAIHNTFEIAQNCKAELPRATMVAYTGAKTISNLCKRGAQRLKVDLEDPVYKKRLDFEVELIESKGYEDYILIIADMIEKAKTQMLVGPGRGSSAGSLVSYLCGITTVDPIEHGLLFERFIDVTRDDLPDIDIDFPDSQRHLVIKQLMDKYGKDKVRHIATVATMKPKSAIGEFAAGLGIPKWETEDVKGAIIERSGGDARAQLCIADTFETTDVGKDFIQRYPEMLLVERIEGHARHAGIHAAGIIVCNDNLHEYAGINTRGSGKDEEGEPTKNLAGTVMIDKNEAEYLGLLKIDCLGLRTLSILQETAKLAGFDYHDYYNLQLDDDKVFEIFNQLRVSGIFQFEGYALQSLTREMGVHNFNDICAITALARPGPIHSGGASIFADRRTGRKPIAYLSDHPGVVEHTRETLGVIIYQEQLMSIGRDYGSLSWEDVNQLRRAASKSLGEEFFNKYRNNFLEGTRAKGISDTEANHVFDNMVTFGSWGFNKSHAVVYGLISYWCAWAKTYHPKEFAVANLNNARSTESAIKLLRDMVKNEGAEYRYFDADESMENWSIDSDGKLLGGLLTIKGIGKQKAKQIMVLRKTKAGFPPGLARKLLNPDTPFRILFPCEHYWGHLFDNPNEHGLDKSPITIDEIEGEGNYLFIGKLVDRNLRDLNEYASIVKRGGEVIEHDTLFLNMTVEDDTASIIATVGRYDFERIGRQIAEKGKVDHDWYLIKGYIKGKWRKVMVKEIVNLWEWFPNWKEIKDAESVE